MNRVIKSLITICFTVKPILMLEESHYYSLNQEAEILCDIVAFPLPNISWSFTRCPEYPTCEDKSTILMVGKLNIS